MKIKGIFIDVEHLDIREIELDNSCEGFYEWLKCDCITAPSFNDTHDVVVDDEGFLKKPILVFLKWSILNLQMYIPGMELLLLIMKMENG